MRVAWFSPLPPQRSGVADYCAELLPYLARHMDLELFAADPAEHEGTPLAGMFPIHDYHDFTRRNRAARFDVPLYQMGNDRVHRFVYDTLVETPGITVLHEPMLHHFMLQMLAEGWTPSDYSHELDYNYGAARGDIEAEVASDGTEQARFRYPMIQRVVDSSLGVIVHSEYARGVVLEHGPRDPVETVSHAYVPDPATRGLTRERARAALGLDPAQFIIGTFGFVTPAKRIETILDCVAELSLEAGDTRLLIAGGSVPEYDLGEQVRSRGLAGRVFAPGYVSWQDLMRYMLACDLALALRWPNAGETPGGVIRLLGLGCPTVVSSHKAFGEFPDDICLKVDHGREREDLLDRMRLARRDPEGMSAMGARAKDYIARNNRPEDTAAGYAGFIGSVLAGGSMAAGAGSRMTPREAVRAALIDRVAGGIAAFSDGPARAGLLDAAAAAIDGVLPPGGGAG